MINEDKLCLEDLRRKRAESLKLLNEIDLAISFIYKKCNHDNNYIAEKYKQHGQGKPMIDRCCRDCGHYWTTYG